MAYKTRPGIEMIQVCGQNMLVASRPVWENCPRVRPIPKNWAVCWTLMKDDKTDEDAVRIFADLLHKTEEEIRPRLEKIFQKLAQEGYIVEMTETPEGVNDAE